MKATSSYQQQGVGLYIVPTPIGNLEDMTYRAVRILQESDIVAAEDTRQTMKLFRHFSIETKLVSYHEHNKQTSGERLLADLEAGKQIALVSDAGMPGISDPGSDLIRQAIAADIPVIVLPGANAALTALVASGLSTERFLYYGFLPRKKKERREALEQLKYESGTLIFYEAPHRLKEMLQGIEEVLGDRQVTLARELTKRYEEYIRGSVSELRAWAAEDVRGEFVVLVEGSNEERPDAVIQDSDPLEQIRRYIEEGEKPNAALKRVAKERGLDRQELYLAFHEAD
ncbi:MAG TPA: 16S rRNA (cytidine(1402)-2'-O)-methyltransferase [Exiguobacterium sp.]|uniref:16S rRNA (cytidine(1402)-2'-O)-methyltransferase n=1 Tax=unclassified Exiguobacterium TaxID=2644629 RepID=UPI0004459B19|nr:MULTISPECIES: 16S rRNA (cytidine(1402)-2'-O)-methyltransferase [unclassified Exiguobacterium]EZP58044.1 16S rRNA methyltransferase [Exiguobacterium sp. RIT341]HAB33712.1 16S rRNA (cytidine(1402)-2'-O)-methyltransferase [Exiguobacterium sp.]HAZ40620.1 16S rRNA (cytidine(1402)-2'-O)-methyltransferase [Exiguobacterium sp.]